MELVKRELYGTYRDQICQRRIGNNKLQTEVTEVTEGAHSTHIYGFRRYPVGQVLFA